MCGFIDSLAVFGKKYPGRHRNKQEHLVKDILQTSDNAHIGNVDSLGSFIIKTSLSCKELLQHHFHLKAVFNSMLFSREK